MARYLSPHCLREMVQLRRNRTSVFFIFILWVARLQYASSAIILHSFSPLTAPRSGGSLLSVTGQDFISGVSQCQFLHSSYGSTSSTNNIVYNSTFMVCTVPLIGFVPQSVLSPTVNVQVRIASPPQLSNSIDLTLFDLTQMSVASINPVEGFNTSATSVSIYGSGFVNTHESTCVTNSLTMTAEYVGPTALRCQMPLYPIPSQVVLDVLLNGQTSSRLARPLNSTIFTYFSTPPNIGVCEFTSSYTLLLLEFDREIEVGNEMGPTLITPLNCGLVFNNESNSILGDGAECSWLNTQQRQVVVRLTPDSTIQLGTLLTINSNTLRTRHVAFSKLASGSIAVQQSPLQPLLPVAIITGPEQIPNCGNLTLSGAQSRNGGPKPLFFMWNITLVMDALTGSGLGSGMNYLNPLKMNIMLEESTDSVSIPAEYFQGDQQYLVILTVRNFLGHQDSSETVLKKSAVLAPNVWVVGKRELSVSVDTEVLIEGVSSLPPCVDKGAGVLYHWAIHSKEPIPFLSYLENPIMAIPAHTLRHSSVYSATLTVTVNSHTANTTVLIRTQREPIVTRIAGGITITHVQQQTLLIDGTASRGLDQTVTNDSSFTAEWSCTQVAVNVSCSSLGVLRMNELQLEIQPNSLLIGEHIFTLTITYNSTSSTVSQTVIVIAHSAPTVTISVLTRPNLVPVHRKLILHGTVSSSHPARAEWSIVYKPGYGVLSRQDFQYALTPTMINIVGNETEIPAATETSPLIHTISSSPGCSGSPFDLVLQENTLLPMNSYRFRLTTTDTLNHTAFSEIDITTGSLPSAGSLVFYPATGTPILTKFLLRATSWTDSPSELPLRYRFGFSLINSSTHIVWLSGILHSNELRCRLPLPSGEGSMNIVAEIYDNQGAVSVVAKQVNLTGNIPNINLSNIYNDIHEVSITEGMWVEGIADILSVLHSLRTPAQHIILLGTSVQEFTRQAMLLTINLFNNKIPQTQHFKLLILQILQETTSMRPQLTNAEIQLVTEVVESIASSYALQESTTFSPVGLPEDVAEVVFSIYGNLIEGYSHIISNRIRSDVVTGSLDKAVSAVGRGLCQQLGVFERSVHVTTHKLLGTVKFYYAPLPGAYNLSCPPPSNVDNITSCPFSVNETSSVLFTENQTISSDSFREPLCIVSGQFKRDLYWSGSAYTHHLKSPQVMLHLINMSDGMMADISDLSYPIAYMMPIIHDFDSPANLMCVLWNNETWSSEGCVTEVLSMKHVLCRCTHLRDTAVIERCPSGFYGDRCQQVCTQGLWGEECRHTCSCSDRGTCSAQDGSCDCNPGWTGTMCQTACATGRWGKHCQELCLCENAGLCHHVDGSCDCPPGWIGNHCNISCPIGQYGKSCNMTCQCRDDTECNKTSGVCHCQDGYIGPICNTTCPNRQYGPACSKPCECITNGTETCDHVTGMCTCLPNWNGSLCSIPPPSPPPPFPVVAVAVSVAMALLVAVMVAAMILTIWLIIKFRSKKKISPDKGTDMNRLDDEISVPVDGEEEDDSLNITRSQSLTAIVPAGKKVSFSDQETIGRFKEPAHISGKMRWQVIQLIADDETNSPETKRKETIAADVHVDAKPSPSSDDRTAHSAEEENQSNSGRVSEVIYKCGVYLESTKTLKDLRNAFIDSGQLSKQDPFFQFLQEDTMGEVIPIDTEEETSLSSLSKTQQENRTIYIEAISKESAALELCVCGKFADLECGECKMKGYCSITCQQADWASHSVRCRLISAKRKRKEKRKRSVNRKVERLRSAGYTPLPDQCVCGKEADFECSQCSRQGYCSETCQLKDWPVHQHFCK